MTSILHKATFRQSAEKLNQLPPDSVAEVAFAGRSNAGKSSALNALTARRKLAHVSKTPGRTRLINYFEVMPGRFLVDLPGYGYAQVPGDMKRAWARLLTGYLNERQQIRGLVVLMDVRHPLTALDEQLLDWFTATGKPVHVLLTKADKLSRSRASMQLQKVVNKLRATRRSCTVQLFSSVNKTGVEDAQAVISGWLDHNDATEHLE